VPDSDIPGLLALSIALLAGPLMHLMHLMRGYGGHGGHGNHAQTPRRTDNDKE
jgi:hypothetical protein